MNILTLMLLSAIIAFTVLVLLPAGEATRSDPVYDVEVGADDYQDKADPGDLVVYQVKIKNTGNVNDSYELYVFKVTGEMSMWPWPSFVGTEDNTTDTLLPGETAYVDVHVEVPEFTPNQDDVLAGLYEFKVLAKSMSNGTVEDWTIFELEVEEFYSIRFWSDIPGKSAILNRNKETEMTFTLNVRNLGNCVDDIVVMVPNDQFCRCGGDTKDWKVKFGTQTSKTVTLDPFEMERITMTVIIDKDTNPGPHTLRVRAESQGDTVVYVFTTVYINLTAPIYGVKLEKFTTCRPIVNPSDEKEIEFKFTLTNTGNQDDTYTVEVETPLLKGAYKGWVMEFENKDDERVDTLSVPTDLKGNTDLYLSKNSRVDITVYVIVAMDEAPGVYNEIYVSATSDNDISQMAFLYFSLTVITPNIRVSDDPSDFYIDPDHNIREGDSVDIHLRLYNDGGAETGEFNVFFYNGKSRSPPNEAGDFITFEHIENIPANSSMFIQVIWENITAGENDIYAYADKPIKSGSFQTDVFRDLPPYPDGGVMESRENDNTASIDDMFQEAIDLRPRLEIVGLDYSTNYCGEDCIVSLFVENTGSASAKAGTGLLQLKIGGVILPELESKLLNPGINEEIPMDGEIEIRFLWHIPDEPRNWTVKASADFFDDSHSVNCRKTFYIETQEKTKEIEDIPAVDAIAYSLASLLIGLIIGSLFMVKYTKKIATAAMQERKRKQSPRTNFRISTTKQNESFPGGQKGGGED